MTPLSVLLWERWLALVRRQSLRASALLPNNIVTHDMLAPIPKSVLPKGERFPFMSTLRRSEARACRNGRSSDQRARQALTLLSFELLVPALPPTAARPRASSHPPHHSQSERSLAAFSSPWVRTAATSKAALRGCPPTLAALSLAHLVPSGPKCCALARTSRYSSPFRIHTCTYTVTCIQHVPRLHKQSFSPKTSLSLLHVR